MLGAINSMPRCRKRTSKRSLSQAWLAEHAEQIRLIFLPTYSPELNPDEMLNQDVKANAVGRRRPHSLPEMMQTTKDYMRHRQRRPALVRRYFHAPSVRYAAPS